MRTAALQKCLFLYLDYRGSQDNLAWTRSPPAELQENWPSSGSHLLPSCQSSSCLSHSSTYFWVKSFSIKIEMSLNANLLFLFFLSGFGPYREVYIIHSPYFLKCNNKNMQMLRDLIIFQTVKPMTNENMNDLSYSFYFLELTMKLSIPSLFCGETRKCIFVI